jgi:hypothetical protein
MLQAWADGLRLSIPVPVALDIAVGNPLETTGAKAGGKVFRQPGVSIYPAAGGGGVCVRWTPARAAAILDAGSATARVTLSRGAFRQLEECARVFLSAVLILLLRRVGWHHLHSGIAADPSGTGWLIVGDSGAGKSTTAALLASSGWRVGNDDMVFLGNAGGPGARVVVAAARTPIALRDDMGRRLGSEGSPLPAGDKIVYWPEELGGRWIDRVEPDVIVFVSAGQNGSQVLTKTTSADAISPREATARLVRASAWVMLEPGLAQGHLELLARLARQARSFRVRLAEDLFTSPGRLQELIA